MGTKDFGLGEALGQLVEAAKRAKRFSISVEQGTRKDLEKYGKFGRGHRKTWEEAAEAAEEELSK